MDYNVGIIQHIADAMSYTSKDLIDDYDYISKVTHNGLAIALWDRRFDMINEALKNNSEIDLKLIYRGNLWSLLVIFDKKNSKLYIMINDKNLTAKRQEYIQNGYSTHYLYSLLLANEKKSVEQTNLFSIDKDEFELRREEDYTKILGELIEKVDEVLVASFSYEQDKIISGKLYLFDSAYNIVDTSDLSRFVIHPLVEDDIVTTENTTELDTDPVLTLKKKGPVKRAN